MTGFGNGTGGWRIPRAKILSRKEVGQVLAAAQPCPWFHLLLVLAANSGLRVSEILHLRRDDYDGKGLRITRRKRTELKQEQLPLAPAVARKVAAFIALQERHGAVGDWLFPGRGGQCLRIMPKAKRSTHPPSSLAKKWKEHELLCEGGHVSKRDVQRKWTAALAAAGLSAAGRGIHALRHYAVTEFYRQHRDLRAAQVFAGHSTPLVTQTYAHVVDLADKVRQVRPTL